MVLISGEGELLRIAHRNVDGAWQLYVDERVSVARAVTGHCGSPGCDAVVGISPDWRGRVWFATGLGMVGLYDPARETLKTRKLGQDERVDNSISTAPGVTSVATNHALYELSARPGGRVRILWRRAYDRGPARKPGQLSYGTGATPTYFGPRRGSELLTITDNAAPTEHLLVYRSSGRGTGHAPARHARPRLVCRIEVLAGFGSGTENSPIGYGRSVIVASTYGYPYPAYPDGAGESQPASAPFTGGMTRVDLKRHGKGCRVRWAVPIRSAAVPKLSTGDGLLYTTTRANPSGGSEASPLDVFSALTIDPGSGELLSSTPLGATTAYETLQLAGNIAPDGTLYQGTLTGILRIAAAE